MRVPELVIMLSMDWWREQRRRKNVLRGGNRKEERKWEGSIYLIFLFFIISSLYIDRSIFCATLSTCLFCFTAAFFLINPLLHSSFCFSCFATFLCFLFFYLLFWFFTDLLYTIFYNISHVILCSTLPSSFRLFSCITSFRTYDLISFSFNTRHFFFPHTSSLRIFSLFLSSKHHFFFSSTFLPSLLKMPRDPTWSVHHWGTEDKAKFVLSCWACATQYG